jgi:hypothetical protein
MPTLAAGRSVMLEHLIANGVISFRSRAIMDCREVRVGCAKPYSERRMMYAAPGGFLDIGDLERHFSMPPSAISDVSLPEGETTISFMLQNFWILINVRLNGKGPFQLMLDSGGRNILSPSVAWQVGATDTGTVPITTSYSSSPCRR